MSDDNHWDCKFEDALGQLQRYGEPDRLIVDILWELSDVNDDMMHGREPVATKAQIDGIKGLLDQLKATL